LEIDISEIDISKVNISEIDISTCHHFEKTFCRFCRQMLQRAAGVPGEEEEAEVGAVAGPGVRTDGAEAEPVPGSEAHRRIGGGQPGVDFIKFRFSAENFSRQNIYHLM
jgi:hypothetical protein